MEDQLGLLDQLDQVDQTEHLEIQVQQDLREVQDQVVHLVLLEELVLEDHRVLQVSLV